MGKIKGPDFLLKRVYSDGSSDEPLLYQLSDIDTTWKMKRRGFLLTSAIGMAILSSNGFPKHLFAEDVAGCADDAKAHIDVVVALSFSPDGRILASGSADKTIKLWEMPSGKLINTLKEHTNTVEALSFSPDGRILASGSADQTIKLWEMPSGKLINTLRGHTDVIMSISFSPDGRILASGSWDKTIKLWEMPSGKLIDTLNRHNSRVWALSFSPNGRILASGLGIHKIELWEIPSGKLIKTLEGHTRRVSALSFSPDGRILASGSGVLGITVKFWKMPSGKLIKHLKNRRFRNVRALSFSPDGGIFAAGLDNMLHLFEIQSGLIKLQKGHINWFLAPFNPKLVKTLNGHSDIIKALSFSPDGRILASGSLDQTIKLWEIPSGKFITCLFDPAALDRGKKVNQYTMTNEYGQSITYTIPCGSPIPPGSICTCNCVPGTYGSNISPSGGGNMYCSCDRICVCVPIK